MSRIATPTRPTDTLFTPPVTAQQTSKSVFRRGQIIPLYPNTIWQIDQGILQLRTQNDQGDITILGWLQQGSFWGKLMTQLETVEAIALADTSLQNYATAQIHASLDLQQHLLRQTLQRLHQSEYLLAIAGLKRIESRLESLLFFLKQKMGINKGDMTLIQYRFTHKNLADAIGTTRVTVTRLFKEFQTQGWLALDGDRHLLIANDYIPEQIF
jgi:CRP-like cAMP-binding protein